MSFPPPLPASVYRSRLILLPSVQGSYKAIETFHGIQATASYWQTVEGEEEERTNKDANVSASIGSDRKETSCCPQIRARDSFCSAILSLSLSFSLSKVDSLKKKREREKGRKEGKKKETNVGSPFGSFCEFLNVINFRGWIECTVLTL